MFNPIILLIIFNLNVYSENVWGTNRIEQKNGEATSRRKGKYESQQNAPIIHLTFLN